MNAMDATRWDMATADHDHWQSPKTRDKPRTLYDASTLGTESAAETVVASVASSNVFVAIDNTYSHCLLHRAI